MKSTFVFRIIIQIILLGFIITSSHATDIKQSLTLVAIDDLPPYSYREDGKEKGIDIEIIKEVFSRLDIDLTIEFNPWARLLYRAQKGEIDGVVATFCTHKDEFLLRTEPFYNSKVSIFSQNKYYPYTVESVEDLKKTNIGKVHGYTYLETNFPEMELNIFSFENDDLLLKNIVAQRIEHVVAEDLPFNHYCKINDSCDKIQKSFTLIDQPICMRLSRIKKDFGQTQLTNRINEVVTEMREEGYFDTILRKYSALDYSSMIGKAVKE